MFAFMVHVNTHIILYRLSILDYIYIPFNDVFKITLMLSCYT